MVKGISIKDIIKKTLEDQGVSLSDDTFEVLTDFLEKKLMKFRK